MSRPQRASFPLPTWGQSIVSYPAGADPWSGTPINSTPLLDYFIPGQPAAAQEVNWELASITTGQANQKAAHLAFFDYISQMQAMNWPYRSLPATGTVSFTGPSAWRAKQADWLTAQTDSAASSPNKIWVQRSGDGGVNWYSMGTMFSPSNTIGIDAIAVHPSTGVIVVHVLRSAGASTSGTALLYDPGNPGAGWQASDAQTPYNYVVSFAVRFQSVYLLFGYDLVGTGAIAVTSPDGMAWTDRTSGIPSAVQGVNTAWFAAASSTTVLALPNDNITNGYIYSTDGIAWTRRTTFPSLTGAHKIVAVTYSDVDGLWMVATSDGGATASKFYTSADGINWTLAGSLPHCTAPRCLAACGSLYVAYSDRNTGNTDTGKNRGYMSCDAGATWRPIALQADETIAGGVLMASDTQFMFVNSGRALGSSCAGLPAVAT